MELIDIIPWNHIVMIVRIVRYLVISFIICFLVSSCFSIFTPLKLMNTKSPEWSRMITNECSNNICVMPAPFNYKSLLIGFKI